MDFLNQLKTIFKAELISATVTVDNKYEVTLRGPSFDGKVYREVTPMDAPKGKK